MQISVAGSQHVKSFLVYLPEASKSITKLKRIITMKRLVYCCKSLVMFFDQRPFRADVHALKNIT